MHTIPGAMYNLRRPYRVVHIRFSRGKVRNMAFSPAHLLLIQLPKQVRTQILNPW